MSILPQPLRTVPANKIPSSWARPVPRQTMRQATAFLGERVHSVRLAHVTATIDSYATGCQDYTAGTYAPPSSLDATYGDYLRGWNDAWAFATGRTTWQQAR